MEVRDTFASVPDKGSPARQPNSAPTARADIAALRKRHKQLSHAIGVAKRRGNSPHDLIQEIRRVARQLRRLRQQVDGGECTDSNLPGAADSLAVDVESSSDALCGLREEWDDLLLRSKCDSPFLTWEWLYTWWEVFGGDKELYLVLARGPEGQLVGAAPLMIGYRDYERPRRFHRRTLAFIGTGECLGPNYLNFITAPGREAQVIRAVLDRMSEDSDSWDMALLRHVPCEQGEYGLLSQLAGHEKLCALVEAAQPCVWGPLPRSFEEYLETVPSTRRRRYLRNQERMLRAQFADLTFSSCDGLHQVTEHVEGVIDLHLSRFSSKGDFSAWKSSQVQRMIREMSARFHERRWLCLDTMQLDGRVAASLMGFRFKGRYFALQSGFAPQFARYDPIHALCTYRIKKLIGEKVRSFDFLGGAYDYKKQYFPNLRHVTTLRVFPESARHRFNMGWRLAAEYVLPVVREAARGLLRRRSGTAPVSDEADA